MDNALLVRDAVRLELCLGGDDSFVRGIDQIATLPKLSTEDGNEVKEIGLGNGYFHGLSAIVGTDTVDGKGSGVVRIARSRSGSQLVTDGTQRW